MNVAIIKYNAGNIQSVLFALERIGARGIVTDFPDDIIHADKVIFPGVGEASSAMRYLKEKKLDRLILSLQQPVLGICLGMQLMCNFSEENNTACMGIFEETTVHKFIPDHRAEKVPQVGWNTIYDTQSLLFKNVKDNSFCYFVHGYYVGMNAYTIAKTEYIQPYSSSLQKNNFYGVQFHPEKSATTGEQILKNFLAF